MWVTLLLTNYFNFIHIKIIRIPIFFTFMATLNLRYTYCFYTSEMFFVVTFTVENFLVARFPYGLGQLFQKSLAS